MLGRRLGRKARHPDHVHMAGVADYLANYSREVVSIWQEVRNLVAGFDACEGDDLGRSTIRVALAIPIRPVLVG